MATLSQNHSSLLRNALRGNSIFSAISGILITFGAGLLVQFMGAGNIVFYVLIGIGLLFHAANLFFNTRGERVKAAFAWYAIIGDLVWVLATVIILLTDAFQLSVAGKWALLIIGDVVLLFAIVQYIGLRRQNRA